MFILKIFCTNIKIVDMSPSHKPWGKNLVLTLSLLSPAEHCPDSQDHRLSRHSWFWGHGKSQFEPLLARTNPSLRAARKGNLSQEASDSICVLFCTLSPTKEACVAQNPQCHLSEAVEGTALRWPGRWTLSQEQVRPGSHEISQGRVGGCGISSCPFKEAK